jgi:hypothetical protein
MSMNCPIKDIVGIRIKHNLGLTKQTEEVYVRQIIVLHLQIYAGCTGLLVGWLTHLTYNPRRDSARVRSRARAHQGSSQD